MAALVFTRNIQHLFTKITGGHWNTIFIPSSSWALISNFGPWKPALIWVWRLFNVHHSSEWKACLRKTKSKKKIITRSEDMYHSESRDCKPVKKKKINTPFVHFGLFVCLFFLFFFWGGGRGWAIIKFLYLQGGCSFEVGRLIEPTLNEQK